MDGHVLIVEDEQRLRDIIRDYFTAHGADCDLARDGAEALELLRENDYDAILLCCKMASRMLSSPALPLP